MRLLLAGASGLIGTEVLRALGDDDEARALVRRPTRGPAEYTWDPDGGVLPAEAIAWADAVVSLSGASLARLPWTAGYRETIRASRVRSTGTIARAIAASAEPPAAWVSGSAVGVYGDRPGEELDEGSVPGTGFLAEVVQDWEAATEPARDATRVVHARTGLVIAPGGALRPLLLATRLGLGATIGSGRQVWPWIGLEDEALALIHLATGSTLSGAVNLVGPEPATSRQITTALARDLHRPHLLRLPAWTLRAAMGAAADELLLADQRVRPRALARDGFAFRSPSATAAVAAAVST